MAGERRMTREQTSAMWLARWQGWRSSGLKMSEYAGREGFNAHSAYRWRRRALRSGQWSDAAANPKKAITVAKTLPAVQFARVAVSDAPAARSSMLRIAENIQRRGKYVTLQALFHEQRE